MQKFLYVDGRGESLAKAENQLSKNWPPARFKFWAYKKPCSISQDCSDAKEKFVTAEVNVKSLQVEKDLIKEANARIMQENESLLNQQRSQSVLLSNLQTIQVHRMST